MRIENFKTCRSKTMPSIFHCFSISKMKKLLSDRRFNLALNGLENIVSNSTFLAFFEWIWQYCTSNKFDTIVSNSTISNFFEWIWQYCVKFKFYGLLLMKLTKYKIENRKFWNAQIKDYAVNSYFFFNFKDEEINVWPPF